MEKVFEIGIIGSGVVAERIINASADYSRTNVKGVYDKNPEKSSEVSSKYNLEAYNSLDELLDDEELDIIYLAVPPKYHYPLALEIFKTGKHFLCEKPLANSTEEAREMSEMANKEDLVYGMNFPTIYRGAYVKLVELMGRDFLGDILRVEFQGYFNQWPRVWQQNSWIDSREQGGFTREVVTHYIQLMQSLFGYIENLQSFINYPEDENISERSLIARANIGEIEVLINCIADIGMKEELCFNIIGKKATISIKNWTELWVSKGNESLKKLTIEEENHLVHLLDNFVRAIDGEKTKLVDFKEGYKVHSVVEKLLGKQ